MTEVLDEGAKYDALLAEIEDLGVEIHRGGEYKHAEGEETHDGFGRGTEARDPYYEEALGRVSEARDKALANGHRLVFIVESQREGRLYITVEEVGPLKDFSMEGWTFSIKEINREQGWAYIYLQKGEGWDLEEQWIKLTELDGVTIEVDNKREYRYRGTRLKHTIEAFTDEEQVAYEKRLSEELERLNKELDEIIVRAEDGEFDGI